MRISSIAIIFSLTLTVQIQANAVDLKTYVPNQKGVAAMDKNELDRAQKKFSDALAADPLNSDVQVNLGISFLQAGQMDKAQAAFETVKKMAKEPRTLFAANYNLGLMMQKASQVDKALSYYQEALKYDPASIETKTNIELLTQEKQGKGGGGDQQNKDQKNDQNQDQSKDQDKDQKDQKSKDPKDKEGRQYGKNKKQPQPFKSQNLTQGDVNKILDELKRQEQRVRAEYNKKDQKEVPRDKDW